MALRCPFTLCSWDMPGFPKLRKWDLFPGSHRPKWGRGQGQGWCWEFGDRKPPRTFGMVVEVGSSPVDAGASFPEAPCLCLFVVHDPWPLVSLL